MPRLSDLTVARSPIGQAGVALLFAEASLNGFIQRLPDVTPEALQKAVDAVYEARERLDVARFAAMGVERLKTREPQPNDRDDMLDAVLMALRGLAAEGVVESGLIQNARRRGEDLIGRAA